MLVILCQGRQVIGSTVEPLQRNGDRNCFFPKLGREKKKKKEHLPARSAEEKRGRNKKQGRRRRRRRRGKGGGEVLPGQKGVNRSMSEFF